MCSGRRFRRVVITHQGDHAAMRRCARKVGMAEHIARAVNAGPLAVPQAEHAIELAFAAHLGLLRAPQSGGGEVFVEAGLEDDVVCVEQFFRIDKLRVEATQRRAAIAGDKAARVEARRRVPRLLHQQQPHNRLRAGDENAALRKIVFVIKCDGGLNFCRIRHRVSPKVLSVRSLGQF